MKHSTYKKTSALILFGLMPFLSLAQETGVSEKTYFSNALFNALLITIILLLIIILALNGVLKNLASTDVFNKENQKSDSAKTNITGLVILFSLLAGSAFSQTVAETKFVDHSQDWLIGGLDYFTFNFMLAIILLEAVVVYVLISLIKKIIKPAIIAAPSNATTKSVVKEKSILEKLNASVDIEKEGEILLDHDYDGIKELDNDLPPWWKYGFYLTILTGVVYLIHYHVIKTGDLQGAEYTKELAQAKLKIEEYMKTAANNVDETTVKLLTSASDIESGKQVYVSTCVACHGKFGEGGVGPNLTDAYWLHNGGVVDIFKTIKYGWPDKGMKSWKADLSPMQIAQVTSYIKTLSGTNPPNPKAPQGNLFTEETNKADTLTSKLDSLTLKNSVIDTLQKK